jgi:hypothetical protein
MQNSLPLNEGLRSSDLKEMVYSTLEIDTYRSKMGEDRDVCVLSFKVKDRAPANDLMEFIEKGYNFVLDADISSGENKNGEYFVFVELDRTEKLAEQIQELMYGVKRLTEIDSYKFKYHKNGKEHELTTESIKSLVPATPMDYERTMNKLQIENYKRFFNKTLMDDLRLEKDIITFYKPFDKSYKFKIIDDQDITPIAEGAISLDEKSVSETFWLTKMFGDYNIAKIGENFLFTNDDKSILLQRIEL